MPIDFDNHNLYEIMHKIIRKVYAQRYGHQNLPPEKQLRRGQNFRSQGSREIDLGSRDGYLIVDFDKFEDKCLSNEFIEKIQFLNFKDEKALISHIQKSFENILQTEVYALTPGLETRKKQIYRVLKEVCLDSCRLYCKCWKLRQYKDSVLIPAELGELQAAASSIEAPQLSFPKPGSNRGPSIKDDAMQAYLIKILKEVGGMTTHNSMVNFVRTKYNLKPVRRIKPIHNLSSDPYDPKPFLDEDVLSKLHESENVSITQEHIIIAKDLLSKMSPQAKNIYYMRFGLEKRLKEIASLMKISISRAYEIQKEIEKLLIGYFSEDTSITPEEMDLIKTIICQMIAEKENS